ncbi:MAG: hypothetical protein SV375_05835 [Thermodesulfobacteriota bacterium]|nr:hypothetical protein [Thermodesulfobacteriota bacterium]
MNAHAINEVSSIRQSLLDYLYRKGILSFFDPSDDMKEKAVVKFAFDVRANPCILYGSYHNRSKEVITIAHEAGHITLYKEMTREETRTYLCSMFASQGVGLSNISAAGQECILLAEAGASMNGYNILKEIGMRAEDLEKVTTMMTKWYTTYESLCKKKVVMKVREKILKPMEIS